MAKLKINRDRLMSRIKALGKVGALKGGGICRLALTDEDRQARDLVVSWMTALGLDVTVDRIGNIVATRRGRRPGLPVMTGSHIDSVRTGGLYDGNLGVLAGLEVAAIIQEAGLVTEQDYAIGVFSNEEGARFTPDMMGSACYQGSLDVDRALATVGRDGKTVGEELNRIGYAGNLACGDRPVRAFLELHIEQGPVLEKDGLTIGCVTGVQGISWREVIIKGVSNHAGTTPMRMRHDAGFVASEIVVGLRRLAEEMGGDQVATVGGFKLFPNLVNVIPNKVTMTIDLRNTDGLLLKEAEQRTKALLAEVGKREGVAIKSRTLARFDPVTFDPTLIDMVEATATTLGLSHQRMPSGAGHDAGLMALSYPAAMIFVPSIGGVSHNVEEYTSPEDLEAGANVLLQVLLELLMMP